MVDIAAGAGAAAEGGSFLSSFFAPKHKKVLEDNPVLRQAQIAWEKKMRTAVDDAVSDAEIIGMLSKKVFAKKWSLMSAFKRLAQGDGKIDAKDFAEGLKGSLKVEVSEDRLKVLIDAFDTQGDGKLSAFEFIRMVSGSGAEVGLPYSCRRGGA